MTHPRTIITPLQLVGKISIAVMIISSICLISLFAYLGAERPDASYNEIIQSLVETRTMLLPAVFISGLLIICLCGAGTWIIGIFAVHEIAGPLYRFSTHVDIKVNDDVNDETPPSIVVHSKADLRKQAEELELAFSHVNSHYVRLDETLKIIVEKLSNDEGDDQSNLNELVGHFLDEEERVRLDK